MKNGKMEENTTVPSGVGAGPVEVTQTPQNSTDTGKSGNADKTVPADASAIAEAAWGALLAACAAPGADGKPVASIDPMAVMDALGMIAARTIDAICSSGPIEHQHQLVGQMTHATYAMLQKHAAIRAAMKPSPIAMPQRRLIIPSR